jgi:hypothetical protein
MMLYSKLGFSRWQGLTRTSHRLSTAAAYPSALTALRSVGLLDVFAKF